MNLVFIRPKDKVPPAILSVLRSIDGIKASLCNIYPLLWKPEPVNGYMEDCSLSPFCYVSEINRVYTKFPYLFSRPRLLSNLVIVKSKRRDQLRDKKIRGERMGSHIVACMANALEKNTSAKASAGSRDHLDTRPAHYSTVRRIVRKIHQSLKPISDSHSETGIDELALSPNIPDHVQIPQHDPDFPDPPKESAGGKPFECPYCFTTQAIENFQEWK